MAKKFVRGITGIKEINKQDLDTNNVNDLLSDGEHNYIHRKKKDKTEEYHNLTNNIKTINSSNTDLLTVTNYNNSNNTATLHPKHDAQKEQVIESTRHTIDIDYGQNGTDETTKVDTNPQIVLEHENLTSSSTLVHPTHVAGTNITQLDCAQLDVQIGIITEDIQETTQRVQALETNKQDKLTAGTNIEITEDNVINCTYSYNPASVEEQIQALAQRVQALENGENLVEGNGIKLEQE